MIKRLFCVLAVFIMMSCAMTITVSADEKSDTAEKITAVFGDSIPAGYGLEGYDRNDPSAAADSFANLWAKQNDLVTGKSFQNFSRMGLPSNKINAVIKSADINFMKTAKVVMISAGGNDVMDTYGEVILNALKDEQELLEKYDIRPDMSDLNSIQKEILSTVMNPMKYEVLDKMVEKCMDEKSVAIYNNIPKDFEESVRDSVSYIHKLNPDAEILLLTPYNPLNAVNGVENKLITSVNNTISEINKVGKELEKDKSFDNKLHCINLLSEFDGKYFQLINVMRMDIHPSVEGHKYILQLINKSLSPETEASETAASVIEQKSSTAESSVSELKTESSSGQRMYIHPALTIVLFCTAILCVTLISISFIMKRVKKSGKKTRK